MDQFGWTDPVDTPVKITYRRSGKTEAFDLRGAIFVLGTDKTHLTGTGVPRSDLKGAELDLTGVPVVLIGGKRKWQPVRLKRFLTEDSPDFEGAILFDIGSGNWDLSPGMLLVTDREILFGKRISGGRPTVQFVELRFLRDGRYVATRARMLHSKKLETLDAEIELEPGPELIAHQLLGHSNFDHPAKIGLSATWQKLHDLESLRVRLSEEQPRNMMEVMHAALVDILEEAGIVRVAQVPADLSIRPEEIDADMVAFGDMLGTVEIPGLGRRVPEPKLPHISWSKLHFTLRLDEVRQITDWPFTSYDLRVKEVDDQSWTGSHWQDPIFQLGPDRWSKIRQAINERWQRIQRKRNYPKDKILGHPQDVDPPGEYPAPVVWGHTLDGEELKAYPVYSAEASEFTPPSSLRTGWGIRWLEDFDAAADLDATAMRQAFTFVYTRKTIAEFTAGQEWAPLPVAIPNEVKESGGADHSAAEAAEQETENRWRQFWQAVFEQPAFACLPPPVMAEAECLKDADCGDYKHRKAAMAVQASWPQAEMLCKLQQTGLILVNWGGYRTGRSKSRNARFLMIQPDGTSREADYFEARKGSSYEGRVDWRIVGSDELALSWSKNNSSAPHEFVVDHMPLARCTQAQLTAVAAHEQEIQQEWPDRSIGSGWGIPGSLRTPSPARMVFSTTDSKDEPPGSASPNPSTSSTEANDPNQSVNLAALTFGNRAQHTTKKDPKPKKGSK